MTLSRSSPGWSTAEEKSARAVTCRPGATTSRIRFRCQLRHEILNPALLPTMTHLRSARSLCLASLFFLPPPSPTPDEKGRSRIPSSCPGRLIFRRHLRNDGYALPARFHPHPCQHTPGHRQRMALRRTQKLLRGRAIDCSANTRPRYRNQSPLARSPMATSSSPSTGTVCVNTPTATRPASPFRLMSTLLSTANDFRESEAL